MYRRPFLNYLLIQKLLLETCVWLKFVKKMPTPPSWYKMKILFFLHLFPVIFSENTADTSSAASINYFDNLNDGLGAFGPEEKILDYVELAKQIHVM